MKTEVEERIISKNWHKLLVSTIFSVGLTYLNVYRYLLSPRDTQNESFGVFFGLILLVILFSFFYFVLPNLIKGLLKIFHLSKKQQNIPLYFKLVLLIPGLVFAIQMSLLMIETQAHSELWNHDNVLTVPDKNLQKISFIDFELTYLLMLVLSVIMHVAFFTVIKLSALKSITFAIVWSLLLAGAFKLLLFALPLITIIAYFVLALFTRGLVG